MKRKPFRGVFLEKIIALPAIILDELISFIKRVWKDERKIK